MKEPAKNLRMVASVGSVTWECPHCAATLVRKVEQVRVLGPAMGCPRCGRHAHVDLATLVVAPTKEANSD